MKGNDLYDAPDLRPGYQGNGTIIYEPLSALSLTQRLGRLRFACYQFTATLYAGLVGVLLAVLSQSVLPEIAVMAGALVMLMVLTVYLIGLMVRRLHDTGKSGWWAVLVLVPVANLLLMIFLFLENGDSMVNRFGTPNPPPGWLVILVGGGYLILNVISLVLSLVLFVVAWRFPDLLNEYMHLAPQNLPLSRW